MANGSHIYSSDISIIYLGKNKYQITGRIYRDCRGTSLSTIEYGTYGGNNGSNNGTQYTLSCTRVNISDVTPGCGSTSSPCTPSNTGGVGEGIEEHIYLDTIDITDKPFSDYASKYCEITFYIGVSNSLSGVFTTGMGGASNGNFAKTTLNVCNLNKCKIKTNSSPKWSNTGAKVLCCNQSFSAVFGANEKDGDELKYKLSAAISSIPNTSVSYTTPFSSQYPMTPYCVPPTSIKCTPNIKTSPPRGFYFDTFTGTTIFTPTKCDEVGLLGISNFEYRTDTSGKKLLIATTIRSVALIVKDDCGYNKSPTITYNKNDIYLCEGDSISVTAQIYDQIYSPYQTAYDSISYSVDTGDAKGSYTRKILDTAKYQKDFLFTWRTKKGQGRSKAYQILFSISDNHCPRPATTSNSINLYVKQTKGDSAWMRKSQQICGVMRFTGYNRTGRNPFFYWQLFDSTTNKLVCSGSGKDWNSCPVDAGGYLVKCIYLSDDYCTDTIQNYVHQYFGKPLADIGKDTIMCEGSIVNFNPILQYTAGPYSYKWHGLNLIKSDILPTNSVEVDRAYRSYFVTIADINGCVFNSNIRNVSTFAGDTIYPTMQNKLFCEGKQIKLDAFRNYIKYYQWNTGDTTSFINVTKKDTYTCNMVSKNNCKWSTKFNANSIPYTIYTLKNTTEYCEPSPTILLDTFVLINGKIVNNYIVTFKGMVDNYRVFNSQNKGKYKIYYTSKSFCNSNDSFTIEVNPKPKALFVTDPYYVNYNDGIFYTDNQSSISDNSKLHYLWKYGTTNSDTTENPIIQFNNGNKYYGIQLKAITHKGCIDSSYRSVQVLLGTQSWLPEGYTLNSSLVLSAKDVSTVELFVFDATGKQVFNAKENKGIGENDLTSGIYFYRLNILKINGSILLYSGKIIR